MKYKKYALVWVFVSCFLAGFAQTFDLSEALELNREPDYQIIGEYNDFILVYRRTRTQYMVQAFDKELKLAWDKEIILDKSANTTTFIIPDKTHWMVVYSFYERGKTVLEVAKFSASAELISRWRLGAFEERYTMQADQFYLSENEQMLAVCGVTLSGELELLSANLATEKTYWQKYIKFENVEFFREFQDIRINNAGRVYVVFDQNSTRRKKEKHRIHLYQLDTLANEFIDDIAFPNQLVSTFSMAYDEKNHQLVFGGLTTTDNVVSDGLFYIRANGADTPLIQTSMFDASFIRTATGLKRKKLGGIPNLEMRELILRQDGGAILLAEQTLIHNYELIIAMFPTTNTMTPQADYLYENVLAASFHPDGSVHWKNILHKTQESENDGGKYASFLLLKTQSNLKLLYNNELHVNNVLYECNLSGRGTLDRKILEPKFDKEYMLEFKKGIQIASNQCIIPTIRNNKLRLVRITY